MSESSTPQEHVTVGVTEAFGAFLNQHGNLYRDFPTNKNMLESPKEAVDFPRKENQQFCNNVFYQGFFFLATDNQMANHT